MRDGAGILHLVVVVVVFVVVQTRGADFFRK